MLAGFLMPVILVRLMSQENYGLTSQFLTLYTSIYTIAALGLHTNVFFFCPSADKEQSDKYITNTLFLLLLFGIISGLILIIPQITHLVFGDSELSKHSDLIIMSIALATVMNVVSPLNTIRQDKWGALLFPGLVAFGRIGTIIYCALVFHDIRQMFFWLFIFQCIITVSILLYTRLQSRFRLDFNLMKDQLCYSLPFGFAVALQLLSNYFDKFVCIRALTPTEYAIYGVAFLSIPGISQIYDSLCQVNIVNMSHSYRSNKVNEILPQYGNFVIRILSFSVPIILIVSLYAEEIMEFLYTQSYISAAPYFRLYSLTFLTSILGAGTILRSMDKTKYAMYAFLLACIIGLPTTYYLIIKFAATGAICGAMINMMLPRFIQMIFEVHATGSTIKTYLPWNLIAYIFGGSLLLLVPFILIKCLIQPNIWICMLESIVYISLLYFIFVQKGIFIVSKSVMESYCKRILK